MACDQVMRRARLPDRDGDATTGWPAVLPISAPTSGDNFTDPSCRTLADGKLFLHSRFSFSHILAAENW
ncbi:hypothetical protein CCMA1212_005679 [Trichoderma ghanense]|uniref:Uncharacterized protein n=1 Tax=Trichoderma ghanense TaxID=65468 RepID=A0ABY2H3S4_9HYPO